MIIYEHYFLFLNFIVKKNNAKVILKIFFLLFLLPAEIIYKRKKIYTDIMNIGNKHKECIEKLE